MGENSRKWEFGSFWFKLFNSGKVSSFSKFCKTLEMYLFCKIISLSIFIVMWLYVSLLRQFVYCLLLLLCTVVLCRTVLCENGWNIVSKEFNLNYSGFPGYYAMMGNNRIFIALAVILWPALIVLWGSVVAGPLSVSLGLFMYWFGFLLLVKLLYIKN